MIKEETIEEVAERLYPIKLVHFPTKAIDLNEEPRNIFIQGVKNQLERSKEDIDDAYNKGFKDAMIKYRTI